MQKKITIPVENTEFEGVIGGPVIDKKDAKLVFTPSKPVILARSFSDTEIKLYEADFFLNFIEQNSSHHALILYGLSAFLTAARSITLFLQAECSGKEGFEQWYLLKRKSLEKNEFAKFLKDTRDTSSHVMYANIIVTIQRQATLNKKRMVYEVAKEITVGFEFDKYQFMPGLKICKDYLKLLEAIIIEAKGKGFLSVDPKHGHKVNFTIGGLPRAR
ncbi:MAG: hypothetical protein WC333_07375 [Dehalococcoidia bacterium]